MSQFQPNSNTHPRLNHGYQIQHSEIENRRDGYSSMIGTSHSSTITATEQGHRTPAKLPTITPYERDRRGDDKYYGIYIMTIIEIGIGIETERHDMIDMINMKNTV